MPTIRKAFSFVGLALCLAGCMPIERTVNHPIDTSQLGQFQPGITTPADVERIYGPPTQTATNSQTGNTVWLYAFSHVAGSAFGATRVYGQGIVFVFDANGRLLSYRTSRTNSNVH